MRYAEFSQLDDSERRRVFDLLTEDDLADLADDRPYEIHDFSPKAERQYFDTVGELHDYMSRNYFPESKPWLSDEAAGHELAHAKCALEVGARGVKYFALEKPDAATKTAIFAHIIGPASIPNIAMAAIAMHPFTSHRSLADTSMMRSLGYTSKDHVRARIERWNRMHGSSLDIPMPETSASIFSPIQNL